MIDVDAAFESDRMRNEPGHREQRSSNMHKRVARAEQCSSMTNVSMSVTNVCFFMTNVCFSSRNGCFTASVEGKKSAGRSSSGNLSKNEFDIDHRSMVTVSASRLMDPLF